MQNSTSKLIPFLPTGYFVYVSAAYPRLAGDEARLKSALYDPGPDRCLVFWYHIYGDDVGTLLVYKQDEDDQFVSASWTRTGDQGDLWRFGKMTVSPSYGKRFRVSHFKLLSKSIVEI